MNSSKENLKYSQILIIGSGIIGKFNALELSNLGLQVSIVDPCQSNNSSNAALGILMGKIYRKRSGRSWELRKESIQLWSKWLKEFNKINPKLVLEKPLMQITTDKSIFEKMKTFVLENPNDGLMILDKNSSLLRNSQDIFSTRNLEGIISYEDGRINPKLLLNTLDYLLSKNNIYTIKDEIINVRKERKEWISTLKTGKSIISKVIILSSSLNTSKLIENRKYNFQLQPVLGQAIEILYSDDSINFLNLPKISSINGKNIIPLSKNKLIIGSTDEYNTKATEAKIAELTNFINNKPKWLDPKNITKKWFGIRSRPIGEGSPILKSLEEGLILCTGLYKNGILLAPVCSKWISEEIKKHI
ncbi:MAG: FAD-dependent oxidoreductase [Prochlorococcus sp. SP3034]|nr:FAD-dependent oxidoreductase [Prochlorococcus sp. SP3034]|tara:strand:- start:5937 stop:7016 length:1080 start_codon:yes stop_codon:yes gene_type:complete